jgi:hypothetical protein
VEASQALLITCVCEVRKISQKCSPGAAMRAFGRIRKINSREIQGSRKDFPPAHRHPAITTNAVDLTTDETA